LFGYGIIIISSGWSFRNLAPLAVKGPLELAFFTRSKCNFFNTLPVYVRGRLDDLIIGRGGIEDWSPDEYFNLFAKFVGHLIFVDT
jgi:hypothetical protein